MARVIGIAGTAKNTGKTTTMTAILEKARLEKQDVGLTSIGYDGETLDNVTGLPKPRIYGEEGMLVAIAQKCLQAGSAEVEVLTETGIRTPLGKIIVGRIKKPGLVVIAGPNKSSELRMIINKLLEYGCDLVMVDGALNRLAPMVETEGLVLATGASRTTDIKKLREETQAISRLLALPVWERPKSGLCFNSLLTKTMVQEMLAQIASAADKPETIFLDGVVSESSFQALLDEGSLAVLQGLKLVLPDPIKILVAGDPCRMHEIINRLKREHVSVYVRNRLNLLAITINPFYPRYRFVSHDYEAAYVDKQELKRELSRDTDVPVINIVEEGVENLWQSICS